MKVRARVDVYCDGGYREKGSVFEHDGPLDDTLERVDSGTPVGPPPQEPRRPGEPNARVRREAP